MSAALVAWRITRPTERPRSAEAKASSRAVVGGKRRGGVSRDAQRAGGQVHVCLGCCWLKGAFEVCASDRDGERSGVLLRIYNPERPPALIMHGYAAPQPYQSSNLEEKKKKQAPSTQRPLQLFITPPSDSSILFICPLLLIPPFVHRQFKAHCSMSMAVVSNRQVEQLAWVCGSVFVS